MDYEDFRKKLTANKDKPAIVNFNAGTTVKGAVDCVDKVLEIITACGFTRDQYYVHCDGALAGLIIPLVEGCDVAYDVSFEKGIDSISVSGHKMLGCPMPCGVVLTRKEHMQRFRKDVEYLNSVDTTIMVRATTACCNSAVRSSSTSTLLLSPCCTFFPHRALAMAKHPSPCGTRCRTRASRACAAT